MERFAATLVEFWLSTQTIVPFLLSIRATLRDVLTTGPVVVIGPWNGSWQRWLHSGGVSSRTGAFFPG